ncbi:MAG: hypothetical protein ACFCGT_12295 [Sandaracinaceae bacterium]
MRSPLRAGLGIGAIALGTALLALAVGTMADRPEPDPPIPPAAEPPRAAPENDEGRPPEHDAGPRLDEDGHRLDPPPDGNYRCVQPDLAIPRTRDCRRGRSYPRCKWQIPDRRAAGGLYRIWRNTTDEHRWGRPGLVSLALTAAAEVRRRWPGTQLSIGDLDAPGPRHQTHDRGVDVDLYLEDAMIARNDGGGRYPENYEGRPPEEVRRLRARVMDLARILAVCAGGQIRIYYNDPEIIRPFRAWFLGRSYASEVGEPMRAHNRLHRFHFHVTVSEDLEPLPVGER